MNLMRAIAKRFVGGVAAPAKTYGRPSGKAKGLPLGVDNLEITFEADGPVVLDRDFRRRHFFSCVPQSMPIVLRSDKRK
jgi:hypothetical protein